MRHAESLEDVDKTAYERIADEDMPLSSHGREQAAAFASAFLNELGSSDQVRLILSPSKRVLETAKIVVSALPPGINWSLATERLIRKQNWGTVTVHNRSDIEKERYRAGVLRYQFPGGESGAEILFRFDLFAQKLKQAPEDFWEVPTLVITHGFEFRVLLKSLFGWTEKYFESLAHPQNCEMKRLAYDKKTLHLLDEMQIHDASGNPDFIKRQTS